MTPFVGIQDNSCVEKLGCR